MNYLKRAFAIFLALALCTSSLAIAFAATTAVPVTFNRSTVMGEKCHERIVTVEATGSWSGISAQFENGKDGLVTLLERTPEEANLIIIPKTEGLTFNKEKGVLEYALDEGRFTLDDDRDIFRSSYSYSVRFDCAAGEIDGNGLTINYGALSATIGDAAEVIPNTVAANGSISSDKLDGHDDLAIKITGADNVRVGGQYEVELVQGASEGALDLTWKRNGKPFSPGGAKFTETVTQTLIDDAVDGKITYEVTGICGKCQEVKTASGSVPVSTTAVVKLDYVDEKGNDISSVFSPKPAIEMTGAPRSEATIVTPTTDRYQFKAYVLSTTEGAEPSGYLDSVTDNTVTFGVGNASHILITYHAKADVNVKYVDVNGRDLYVAGIFPADVKNVISGLRGNDFELPVPMLANYTFKELKVETAQGKTESVTGFDAATRKGKFNIGKDTTISVIYMPNTHVLAITDPAGKALPGGTIKVYNKNSVVVPTPTPFLNLSLATPGVTVTGSELYSGTADANGRFALPVLPEGNYVVLQQTAANGYYVTSENWNFAIDKANAITGTTTVKNYQVIKTVQCVAASTNSVIKNATIGVYDSANKLITSGTTDDNGKVQFWLQAPGQYTIKQTKVDAPYTLSSEVINVKVANTDKDTGNNLYTIRNTVPVQTGAAELDSRLVIAFVVSTALIAGGVFIVKRFELDR